MTTFHAATKVLPIAEIDVSGRALDLERVMEVGRPVTSERAQWLRVYQSTPEYRAERMLWSDFGDAYFG